MTKKISQLPSVTTPLSAAEVLALKQSGRYVRAGIGVAQVPQAFGDLPTTGAVGGIAYVPDAAGGARPAYWDGTNWKTFGSGGNVNTMGLGIWVVGVGPSAGPAHEINADDGYYFTSEDGFIWTPHQWEFVDLGFESFSYANGTFISGSQTNFGGLVGSSVDPRDPGNWKSAEPNGASGEGQAGPATAYDNDLGTFTVPIGGVDKTIETLLPGAVNPDPSWPWIGQDALDRGGISVVGVGTKGPVEVRINTKQITITSYGEEFKFDINGDPVSPVKGAGLVGTYDSNFLQARKFGGSYDLTDTAVISSSLSIQDMLAGKSGNSAGLVLRGLVWGPLKATAVQFAPGDQ